MTVDGEEKKIVLLTEGDEMKGKCEEKDLQLDELFRSAVEETPAPRESVMLPAKELLRNKQAQNRENAEKKRRFGGVDPCSDWHRPSAHCWCSGFSEESPW